MSTKRRGATYIIFLCWLVYTISYFGKVNSGFYAGILNGFCCLGSTISSYGLGYIAQHFGWTTVFAVLIAVCIAVVVIWGIYKMFCKSVNKKTV